MSAASHLSYHSAQELGDHWLQRLMLTNREGTGVCNSSLSPQDVREGRACTGWLINHLPLNRHPCWSSVQKEKKKITVQNPWHPHAVCSCSLSITNFPPKYIQPRNIAEFREPLRSKYCLCPNQLYLMNTQALLLGGQKELFSFFDMILDFWNNCTHSIRNFYIPFSQICLLLSHTHFFWTIHKYVENISVCIS